MEPLIERIESIYRKLDEHVVSIERMAGSSCPDNCGVCCFRHEVETTAVECYPVAAAILQSGQAEAILEKIETAELTGTRVCVLYKPDSINPDRGRCGSYAERPLICRLFGYAASRDKYGEIRYMPCRIAAQAAPDVIARVSTAILSLKDPPIFSDYFHEVADVKPSAGYNRLPINSALKEAIEQLSWSIAPWVSREDAS